jgi:hypothetical protein
VTRTAVVLYRVRPLVGNYFIRPTFYGTFEQHDGKVRLRGKFTTSRFAKLFMLTWIVALLLLAGLFTLSLAQSEGPALGKVLVALFFPAAIILGVAVHLYFKRLFAPDVELISGALAKTLKP